MAENEAPQKKTKGAWVAHNYDEVSTDADGPDRWFYLFGSELAARRHAMDYGGDGQPTVERLAWGEGRSE